MLIWQYTVRPCSICLFKLVCSVVSVDHPVSQPIPMGGRRGAGFPGADAASILSPRDASGGLGVKMVEYVLGGSPTGNTLFFNVFVISQVSPLEHLVPESCKIIIITLTSGEDFVLYFPRGAKYNDYFKQFS